MKQCEFPKCGRGKSRCMCEGDPVTAPTPDAVAQARKVFLNALYADLVSGTHTADAKLDALIAAVRAECAADTKRLDWLATKGNDWEIRGMTELSSGSPPKRLFIVGHGGNLAMGHAVHERDEIALRSAIDTAMEAHP